MQSAVTRIVLTDEQLAAAVARRLESVLAWQEAKAACAQLYERHARRLLVFLSSRVNRSDLEDIHQGVWERVWHRIPDGFRGGNFRAWLYQVSRNYLMDHHRRKRAEQLDHEDTLTDQSTQEPDWQLCQRERMAVLADCLAKLGEAPAALVRARLAGQSYEEICGQLNLPPERAHKLFHQAKTDLQNCVKRAER